MCRSGGIYIQMLGGGHQCEWLSIPPAAILHPYAQCCSDPSYTPTTILHFDFLLLQIVFLGSHPLTQRTPPKLISPSYPVSNPFPLLFHLSFHLPHYCQMPPTVSFSLFLQKLSFLTTFFSHCLALVQSDSPTHTRWLGKQACQSMASTDTKLPAAFTLVHCVVHHTLCFQAKQPHTLYMTLHNCVIVT